MWKLEIRELSISELEDAANLIRKVFLETEAMECQAKGVGFFLDSVKADSFLPLIREENYLLYGLFFDDGGLAGVLGARGNYLALLFVDQKHKGKGCGRELFDYYKKRIASGEEHYGRITTNSSIGAQNFYEKLGFKVAGEKVEIFGVPYIPMMMVI
ncbi:MAG TPA: GNAT family N-acetyltransferase [Proteiniclasticum sp.]|nr:GNAT family N-acetyltransferase [Proteiniclasticum sp.]